VSVEMAHDVAETTSFPGRRRAARRGTGPDFSFAACARGRAERSTDDGATRGRRRRRRNQ
jgi:hypothetical protein